MNVRLLGLVVLVAMLGACASSGPARDIILEEVRVDLQAAEADERVVRYAPGELQAARLAVRELEQDRGASEEVRVHRSYMAKRKLDIARARAAERFQRNRLVELERERDRMLVEASLREAEAARREAERLRQQSIVSSEEAERARRETQAARARSAEIQQEANLARREAEQAQQLAAARERQAELARQEAELAAAQASSLRRQLQNLQARETDRGLVFTLGDVLFETGQAELKGEALANLDRLVGFIEEYPDRMINIEGHTDDVGSEASNEALSQRRAEAVRAALIDRGIPAPRMKAIGLGEAFPIADNTSTYGRQQNRRVEIVLLKPQGSEN